MALKTAQLNFTDENGFAKTILLSVSSVHTDYEHRTVRIVYKGFKDADSQDKGVSPLHFQHEFDLDLTNVEQYALLLQTSVHLWTANNGVPLIPDFSDTDAETGKVQPKLKSLAELGAVIIDIE